MNKDYSNQMAFLFARQIAMLLVLIFVAVYVRISIEEKILLSGVIAFTTLVLDLIFHLRLKWNYFPMLIATLITIPFLNFNGEYFVTLTLATILSIFFSPFCALCLPNKQEKISATA